jgi:hypothetical protein
MNQPEFLAVNTPHPIDTTLVFYYYIIILWADLHIIFDKDHWLKIKYYEWMLHSRLLKPLMDWSEFLVIDTSIWVVLIYEIRRQTLKGLNGFICNSDKVNWLNIKYTKWMLHLRLLKPSMDWPEFLVVDTSIWVDLIHKKRRQTPEGLNGSILIFDKDHWLNIKYTNEFYI